MELNVFEVCTDSFGQVRLEHLSEALRIRAKSFDELECLVGVDDQLLKDLEVLLLLVKVLSSADCSLIDWEDLVEEIFFNL